MQVDARGHTRMLETYTVLVRQAHARLESRTMNEAGAGPIGASGGSGNLVVTEPFIAKTRVTITRAAHRPAHEAKG